MRTIVAILALSPALLQAQTHTPAQPVSTPTLRASLETPAIAAASAPAAPAVAVTTGVIAPRLVQGASFTPNLHGLYGGTPGVHTVVLDVALDVTGKPSSVRIMDSDVPRANFAVMNAVSQFRYQPATLDGAAIPIHLRLTYKINPSEL